jgi:hypothetical protein
MKEENIMNKQISICLIAFLLVLNSTPIIDNQGEDYFDKTIKNATITYIAARGINGIISVLQGTNIDISPAGIGASFSPGELLDPLNDLVEQFSTVMLASIVSLGIQKTLMAISSWWVVKIIFFILLILLLFLFVRPDVPLLDKSQKIFLTKFIIIALAVRFTIPFVVLANNAIETIFLNTKLQNNIEQIILLENETANYNDDPVVEKGWFESMTGTAKELCNVKGRAVKFKEKISESVNTMLDLITLFIIQTIVFPLLFLFVFLKFIKYLTGKDFALFFPLYNEPENNISETNDRQQEEIITNRVS